MIDKTKKKNRDFIAKIKTLNIGTGAKPEHPFPDSIKCKDCGKEWKLKGAAIVELHPVTMPNDNPNNN